MGRKLQPLPVPEALRLGLQPCIWPKLGRQDGDESPERPTAVDRSHRERSSRNNYHKTGMLLSRQIEHGQKKNSGWTVAVVEWLRESTAMNSQLQHECAKCQQHPGILLSVPKKAINWGILWFMLTRFATIHWRAIQTHWRSAIIGLDAWVALETYNCHISATWRYLKYHI